jgi:hypothetical protein
MRRWAEAGCDYKCCNGKFIAKEYFSTILELSEKVNNYTVGFAPMWSEGTNELKWRIKCMKKYNNIKLKKSTMAVVMALAIGTAGISVQAANHELEDAYNGVYVETADLNDETTELVDDYVEYTTSLDELKGYTLIQEPESPITTYSGAVAFSSWVIPTGNAYMSSIFKATKGDTISVMAAISPKDKTVRVGIIQPDGSIRYAEGSGTIIHQFEVKQTGYHKIIIMNDCGVTVTATGSYSY